MLPCRPFSSGVESETEEHWMSHAWPRSSSPSRGEAKGLTTKRRPGEQKDRPEEMRGQRGGEGGRGSQERGGLSRIPGPGRGRGLSGSGAAGAALQGPRGRGWGARIHLAEEDFTWAEGRKVVKGFKQENVAK